MKKTITLLLFIFTTYSSFSQNPVLENNNWKLTVNNDGTVKDLKFKESNTLVKFSDENFTGPSWYLEKGDSVINLKSTKAGGTKYSASYKSLNLSIEYKDDAGKVLFLATIKNNGHTPFQPNKLGLRLGVNTYMDKYPDWEDKLFPTLLRCEPTHFWGYFMGTTGKIIAIASPDPIASWSHNYSTGWGVPPYQFIGHRITSVNLDLINALPLPERHPQNLWQVLPGETKTFRIYLEEVDKLTDINKTVQQLTKAPAIDITSTACEKGGAIDFSVLADNNIWVKVCLPDGTTIKLQPEIKNQYHFDKTSLEGLYCIKVFSENGKQSEASFYVRKPYSWYMQKAMQAVLDFPQKASKSHCEAWYGFFTTYSGGKYFPSNNTISKADKQFGTILPMILDTVKMEPFDYKYRIQNEGALIGIITDRYQLFNDVSDLEKAIKLSEFILKSQSPDGAYRARKVHYTSVLYQAKSLMELMEALEPLKNKPKYKKQYKKLYASVKLAMDDLVRNRANIETEGQLTFEDGMIACSALQLGEFALLQTDKKEKEKYLNASIDLLTQHRCLEQLIIPDARMRGGSLRFWEAQYDVLMYNNFFNSPHGWSSWSLYANYYLYLLTGDTEYLIRTFNGIDAAMQMIDIETGKLRWAFAVNPYLKITQIKENIEGATPMNYPGVHYHAKQYPNAQYIMGEQYVNMVSDWFFANANDNDVHEHFKCLEEVALGKAYVAEKDNGELITFNCKASINNNKIVVVPNEDIVKKVHVNLKSDHVVEVQFHSKTATKKIKGAEMEWIND
jgi:hypothetical protein